MMDVIVALFQGFPPYVLGILLGSALTVTGVFLTNASNIKRLRIQHEHERNLDNKNRYLNLRRDVFLAAMEAISAGLVAVGRFADLATSEHELMQSYTDRSPSISKTTIVGNSETIKAVAVFNQQITGAFLRLGAQRQKAQLSLQRSESIGREVEQALQEQGRLLALMNEDAGLCDEEQRTVLRQKYETETQRVESLQAEQAEVGNQHASLQIRLVQECVAEIADLDRLLIPVIRLMRSELELSFNEEFYTQIIEEGHRKQKEYLEAYFRDSIPEWAIESKG